MSPGAIRTCRRRGGALALIQVRNRATVIGSICRASPSADSIPPLIADGASIQTFGPDGPRVQASRRPRGCNPVPTAASVAGRVRGTWRLPVRLLHAGHPDHDQAPVGPEPLPTDEEIRFGLSGNICRCAGYTRIFDAIRTFGRRTAAARTEGMEA